MEDEGFYAMALGPNKEQIRSIGSNVGQALATGIIPKEKGSRVARRLMEPDMFSGWGIRTLSSDHVAYNPFSYHLGSVWPVESGTIALGFGRYGCIDELHRLAEGLFAATELFVGNRLPEVLGGLSRDAAHPHPGIYRGSNEPQGWSESAIVVTIQSLLGMRAIALLDLLILDPALPPWLPNFRLEFRRVESGQTDYRVTRRDGSVRVLHQPPPNAPSTGFVRRAQEALSSLGHS
jgi:glycogen debranching enzyme